MVSAIFVSRHRPCFFPVSQTHPRQDINNVLYFQTEIAQHDQMGISVILFMDELSQITTGGYREDGVGM